MAKDKKWIQKATKSIERRGTKGKCTPITKPGCTGKAKTLAKTFKKMAKKQEGGKVGGERDLRAASDSLTIANKNNPWVQRYLQGNNLNIPDPYNPGSGKTSSHGLSYHPLSDSSAMIYPEIVQQGDSLVKLDNDAAREYAIKNKTGIVTDLELAKYYSQDGLIQHNMSKKQKGGKVKGDPKFSKLDQRIYDNVRPFGYSTDKGLMKNAIKSIRQNKGDRLPADPLREELWKYALGSSDELQHFSESQYTPSKATDSSAKYMTPRGLDRSAEGLNWLMRDLPEGTDKAVVADLPLTQEAMSGMGEWGGQAGGAFGNFTISKGKDKKGTYVSIYDKWDLGNKQANKFLDRKPEIYDRIYYNENPNWIAQKEFETRIKSTKGAERKAVIAEQQAHLKEFGSSYEQGQYLPTGNNEVEEFGAGGILLQAGAGAAKGALAGSVVPGWGTAIGAVGGFLGGLWKGIKGNREEKRQEEMLANQEEALLAQEQQTPGVNPIGAVDVNNQYAPTFCKGGKVRKMPTGGFVDSKLVELEDGETFKSPDGTMAVTKTTAPTHEEGGIPLNLEIGTKVIGDEKNIDKKTGMTFRESGRKIAAMNTKYQKLLDTSRGTFTRNAAEAMLRKADKNFDETYERQEQLKPDEEREPEKFFLGGAIGGLAGLFADFGKNRAAQGFANVGKSLLGGGDPTQISLSGAGVGGPGGVQGAGLGLGQKLWQGAKGLFGGQGGQGGQGFLGQQGGLGGLLNTGAQLAPVGYNLIQGMRPAHQQQASDFYNPEYDRALASQQRAVSLLAGRGRPDIDPQLEANRNAQAIAEYNARTQGGLSAGAVSSARQAGTAQRMRGDMGARQWQQEEYNRMLAQQAGAESQLGQLQAGLGAGRAATELRIDESNLAAQAARRNMMGTGFGQMSQYAQMQQMMQNQQGADQQRLQILEGMEPMFKKWFGNLNQA